LATGSSIPSDIHHRIVAVKAFLRLPEAEALTAANKRIRNLLRKQEAATKSGVDTGALQSAAEIHLAKRIEQLSDEAGGFLQAKDYEGALKCLAGLRTDVDAFFDEVMVMVEDQRLRQNRLALMRSLERLFLQVADLSRLQ
jgi:glycyl-tRNA synthetase beta chain